MLSAATMTASLSPSEPLLAVEGLKIEFSLGHGRVIKAVDGLSLQVREGEILGLVGESGSGKTVTAVSLLRLVPPPGRIVAGRILFRGEDIMALPEEEVRRLRGGQIAMIFQNAQLSLHPIYPVGRQLMSVLRLHRGLSRAEAKEEAVSLLGRVRIPDAAKRFNDYPHQLSGGLCQRVMIAMALSCRPSLLIADEPTSSLDVTIQAQIIDLVLEIRDAFGMAVLFISHDLGVVAQVSDRVAVMNRGQIVEEGTAAEIFSAPKHPYTQLLLDSVPVPDPARRRARGVAGSRGSEEGNY